MRETLELEGVGARAKDLSDARVEEAKNERSGTLRTAAEPQRLEKLGEGDLLLCSTLDHDDVRPGVAQCLRGFDERPRIGRSNACHDLRAGRERELSDGATRCLFATVNEGHAKRSTERGRCLLDGGPYP